jgi:hypothetical protein
MQGNKISEIGATNCAGLFLQVNTTLTVRDSSEWHGNNFGDKEGVVELLSKGIAGQ